MTDTWSPSDIGKLIDLVRENPDLYDQSSAGYSNINTMDRTWRKIKVHLPSRTEQQLKKKWQILRTGYRTRRNEHHLPSGSGAKVVRKWPYFEALSFLEPYLTERATTSNVPSSSFRPTQESQSDAYDDAHDEAHLEFENNFETENAEEIVLVVEDAVDDSLPFGSAEEMSNGQSQESSICIAEETSQESRSTSKKSTGPKKKLNPIDESFISYIESKKAKVESAGSRKKSSNELFLLSLLEDMNKLPPQELRIFKNEVLQKLNAMLENVG